MKGYVRERGRNLLDDVTLGWASDLAFRASSGQDRAPESTTLGTRMADVQWIEEMFAALVVEHFDYWNPAHLSGQIGVVVG